MSATSSPMNSNTVLSAQGLVMRFGGITATNNVTLNLQKGARHALIGPNGAGKTTLINLLTGVLQPTEGRIVLEGEDITHLAPHQRVRRGMVRTFQINQLFDSMSPMQTLAMVVSQHKRTGRQVVAAAGAPSAVWWSGASNCLSSSTSAASCTRKPGCWPTASAACWRLRLRWPASPACYCSTNRWPVCLPANAKSCCKPWQLCRRMYPSF